MKAVVIPPSGGTVAAVMSPKALVIPSVEPTVSEVGLYLISLKGGNVLSVPLPAQAEWSVPSYEKRFLLSFSASRPTF